MHFDKPNSTRDRPTEVFDEPAESVVQHSTSTRDDAIVPISGGDVGKRLVHSHIGRYQLLSLVGSGGFGEVWRGYDPQLQRVVAIKIPRPGRLRTEQQREKMLLEARKMARLAESDGVVQVYDAGYDGHDCYIVSQFIEGQSLAQRMHRGPLPRAEAVALVAKVAETLHRIHRADLVHRDIKPSNILLDSKGRPYVCDFGLAASEEEQLSEAPSTRGTYYYMPPEQAQGNSHLVDGRADIYSLGAVFYELLTGRRHLPSRTSEEYRRLVCECDPRPLRAIDDTIPIPLERICLRCLERDRSRRYSTGQELAAELRAWLARPRSSRRKWALAATVVLAVLLVVWASSFFLRGSGLLANGDSDATKIWSDFPTDAPKVPYPAADVPKPEWDPASRRVRLQATAATLYELCRIEQLPCSIHLQLADCDFTSPTAFAGLYMGLRDYVFSDGAGGKRYQLLLLAPERSEPFWRIERHLMRLRFDELGTHHLPYQLISSGRRINPLKSLEIKLTLTAEGLQILECDNKRLHLMSDPELNAQTAPADYMGSFGVYLQDASCTVRGARLKYDIR